MYFPREARSCLRHRARSTSTKAPAYLCAQSLPPCTRTEASRAFVRVHGGKLLRQRQRASMHVDGGTSSHRLLAQRPPCMRTEAHRVSVRVHGGTEEQRCASVHENGGTLHTIQKFAFRFLSSFEAENFMNVLKEILDSARLQGLPCDSDLSYQAESVCSIGPAYRPEENWQYTTSVDTSIHLIPPIDEAQDSNP
ncbi:unnamed protein product [Fraxinus pennsylvanica]|uniref:Poor homologous synapsis 1 PH domain-containing protein n=1 Tax=Fraxinus pennsylvanica TaxID=56036 RepID=A0AAD2DRX7_9LAMI|nr:unnamed protein product [Fraxinus pennsylvanica]